MELVTTIQAVRTQVKAWKKAGYRIGLVPTMGYLHEGHGSLMDKARENDKVVVSIFVNPMQFGANEDLSTYPRDLEQDMALCEARGVDLIFHPAPEELYPDGFCSFVNLTGLSDNLCGESRPIHFKGVCTVVSKLLNIVAPDRAYFGEKDAQQLAILRRMAEDLNFDVELIGCPIVREADGLAKSSRNSYLSEAERTAALVLSRTIFMAQAQVEAGERDAKALIRRMTEAVQQEPLAKIDYIKAVNGLTMRDVDTLQAPCLVAMAVYIGKTRLIDNLMVRGMGGDGR